MEGCVVSDVVGSSIDAGVPVVVDDDAGGAATTMGGIRERSKVSKVVSSNISNGKKFGCSLLLPA